MRGTTDSRELSRKSSTDTTIMEINTLSTEVIYSGARILNEKKTELFGDVSTESTSPNHAARSFLTQNLT